MNSSSCINLPSSVSEACERVDEILARRDALLIRLEQLDRDLAIARLDVEILSLAPLLG